jgi:twinkle protein
VDHDNGSTLLFKGGCPDCGSSDALGNYDDGHTHCFSCGEHKGGAAKQAASAPKKTVADLIIGAPITTSLRGITPETFAFFRYTKGVNRSGQEVHLANHYVGGQVIGQKVRDRHKSFNVVGKLDTLYGRWLWSEGGKMVVVTEGEIDCLSVSQAQGNKWPVVSVPNGAQGAAQSFKKAIDWLESFDKVVIMFDEDEPGRAAALECATILSPGKAFIATLPVKDANELLKAERSSEIVTAIWNAKPYRPDGIVSLRDCIAKALAPTTMGAAWFIEPLTLATYGRREGDLWFLGAGTGVGKTDFMLEQVSFDLNVLKVNVGLVFLEQDPAETVKRLAGKIASKRFHVPDAEYTSEELLGAIEKIESGGKLHLYDNFGSTEWKVVKSRIRFMAVALGCKHIYLDHLTALASHEEDERKALEAITAELSMMAKELKIILHVVSHLATPDKGSHEEGARVQIRHFKGSRAIGFWAHGMIALERDQQNDDPAQQNVTTLRVLKDRYTGQATGKTFQLKYDHVTGRLFEFFPEHVDAPSEEQVGF